MKERPSTSFLINKAFKKHPSFRKSVKIKEQVDRNYKRKLNGKLSKRHGIVNCDRNQMKATYSHVSSKKLHRRMETYSHETKRLIEEISNKHNFSNKNLEQKCRRLSSKLPQHKRKVLFRSRNNASELSSLCLSKIMTHSPKMLQSRQTKEDSKINTKQCFSDRKSILKLIQVKKEKILPVKFEGERINPSMTLYEHIPNYVYTALQPRSDFSKKRIPITPKSAENSIKRNYALLPVTNTIESFTENEIPVNDHVNNGVFLNTRRSKPCRVKMSRNMRFNKNDRFSNAELEYFLSKLSLKVNSITSSVNEKFPCNLIENTAINKERNYAKEYNNISRSRHLCIFKNNNENKVMKIPFFQTYDAFNVQVSQSPKKISFTSFLRGISRESGLNEINKCDSRKQMTKRNRHLNDLKVTKTKMPRKKRSLSISRSSSSTEPKKATISSIKFKRYLKSTDNRNPSNKEIRSSLDFNTQSFKNKRPNKYSHKKISLSQSVHATKKKNKSVTCAKGGIKGIYIQYKGTWGRPLSNNVQRRADKRIEKGNKLKTKNTYTKLTALQKTPKEANVEEKKKYKVTKHNSLTGDMVVNKDQQSKTDKLWTHTKNRNIFNYVQNNNITSKKFNSEKRFPDILKYKSSSIRDKNRRKSMLPYISNLNYMFKTIDDSKLKRKPNTKSIKSKSTISSATTSNSKVPTNTSEPTKKDVTTKKVVGFLKHVPDSHNRTKKTREKHYSKTPILKRCFYALGVKNKVKHLGHIKQNSKSFARNSRIDWNTKKEKYKMFKNRQEPIPMENKVKHKSISNYSIIKHVSKGNSKNRSVMNKNNRRDLSKIFRALNMTTLSPSKECHKKKLTIHDGRIYRQKGNNNFTSDHAQDYMHQHNKVNKKSISLSNNNVQVKPKALKRNQSKTRNCIKRKQVNRNHNESNSFLKLNKYNRFRTMQSLIYVFKRKQMSNETDLSKGDNNNCCKKTFPKKFALGKENHPKIYKSPSIYSGGSKPFRVRKQHNIFGENIRTNNYKTKQMPSVSRTSLKTQENHGTIGQCINSLGFKRYSHAETPSAESIISSNKKNNIKKSLIKDCISSRNKGLPQDKNVTKSSILKISNKSKNTDCRYRRPKHMVDITNIAPSKSKINIRAENSDIKKHQKAKSSGVKVEVPNTQNMTFKTKNRMMNLSLKQKTCVISSKDKTSCDSSTCHRNKVGYIKCKQGAILKSANSSWNSITNVTKSSLMNILKKVVKPLFKQKPVSEKNEQDASTLKLEMKKKVNECPLRSVECQIDDQNRPVKLHFIPKKESPPDYKAPSKSSTYFKNKIGNLLSFKRKRNATLINTVKPKCQVRKSVTCETESNIVPLLKSINRIKPSHKKPNAATKAALLELQANDPTLPKSAKDPVLKLIVDKNTMNVLNRDEIVYGLGSRRNKSGAVKQGSLALRNKLIKAPAMDLIINRDDARIIGADTKTTRGSHLVKSKCNEKLCAGNKGKNDSKYVSNMKSPGQSRKTKNFPCIYQCPECLKIRGQQTDRTKAFREPKTAGMVATEKVLDNISNVMLGWVGRSHCVCGTPVCKKERAKMEQEKRKQKIKIKPCTCGSYECEAAMAKKYHKHKIKRGKRKYKALKQKHIEKLKERQRTHMENALAKEKNKLVTMDKVELQKQYAKEDAIALKRRKKREKEALKRVETFKNANDFFLLTESVMDIGKLAISVVFNSLKSSIAAISNPKLTIRKLKVAARDPKRALHRMSQSCKSSEASAIIRRMHRRGRVMKIVIFLKNAMQSNPVTNYLLHITDPQKRLRKIRKHRDPLDYNCSLYMGSLRKRPCLWVYYLCPWFYPHCVSLVSLWRQFTDILLFILAVGVWSPCILCTEFCRALMCCCFCSA